MNLIIYVNNEWEEDPEHALIDLNSGEVLLNGDHYHDKISDKIDGFLLALDRYNLHKGDVPVEYIPKDHEWFQKLDFYDEE